MEWLTFVEVAWAAGKKNAAVWAALIEGYKTLNSEEEVCISRVVYSVAVKPNG
jgi:hypothetical protein